MKIKLCIYITFIILFFVPFPVNAVEINSYLVTEGQEFIGNPSLNKTYFYKNIPINYQSGRVVLSFNPDGTGDMIIGEELLVNKNEYAFTYSPYTTACNTYKGISSMKPLDITHLLHKGLNNIKVSFRKVWCNQQQISQMYLVHFNDYEPTTEPFLDLPWNYTSKGLSFADAATKMSSYFDHQYPLLSASWFLQESGEYQHSLMNYKGISGDFAYSGHDGYDYAAISKAFLGDSVLAAAAGTATFHNNCSACGNAIHIDHGNGYQTRYYHLQPDGLITNNPNQQVTVTNRQQIGKVGLTGRTDGAHIHFMVIKDKNGDGNFEDNIPDGMVDPYGWQGNDIDPWTQFSFTQNDQQKTGAKSTYLWTNPLIEVKRTLSSNGGVYTNNRYTFTFPKNTTVNDIIFSLKPVLYSESSATLQPIGHVIEATADDGFGNFITQFSRLFTITFKILFSDTSRYKPDSLSIYSSTDGTNWIKENTTINTQSDTATTQVDHLTQFAFMGEKIDSIAPETTILINNESIGETTLFQPIHISLEAIDEPTEQSLGVDYTLYKVNEDDWQLYNEPFEISQLGEHKISYYSVDNDTNIEEIKTATIYIDEPITPTPTVEPTFTPTPTIIPTPTVIPDHPESNKHTQIQTVIENVVQQIKNNLTQKKPIITSLITIIKTIFAF
ncbi:MAG TPA: M23 family metallopeptidase [Candidatus Woesebacteria bacterium]|nr:M23 family metallopeptidase [Candidatus Woesebacteria bacterium]